MFRGLACPALSLSQVEGIMPTLMTQLGGIEPHLWTQQVILLTSKLMVRKELGRGSSCQGWNRMQAVSAPGVSLFPRRGCFL